MSCLPYGGDPDSLPVRGYERIYLPEKSPEKWCWVAN